MASFDFKTWCEANGLKKEMIDTLTAQDLDNKETLVLVSGYVHTGLVPNGSDLKIVTDRPFVHTGPANHTINPFPIRSDNWTSKKGRNHLEPVPCEHNLRVQCGQTRHDKLITI